MNRYALLVVTLSYASLAIADDAPPAIPKCEDDQSPGCIIGQIPWDPVPSGSDGLTEGLKPDETLMAIVPKSDQLQLDAIRSFSATGVSKIDRLLKEPQLMEPLR